MEVVCLDSSKDFIITHLCPSSHDLHKHPSCLSDLSNMMRRWRSPSLQSTRPANKACMRLREISSCSCLTLSPPGSCLTRSAYPICGPCMTLLVLGRESEEAPQGQAGDAVAVGVRPRPRAVQLHVQLRTQQEERPKVRGAAASLFR